MTLVLHQHPFASYCQKVLIALYELDVPFESRIVEGEEGRAELAALWPMATIPVLRDDAADLTLPESTTIIEYVAPALVPDLQARLWDRFFDNHISTPMQKIVADQLRPADAKDRTESAKRGPSSTPRTAYSTPRWPHMAGPPATRSPSPTVRPRRRSSTRAPSTAGATNTRTSRATTATSSPARRSPASSTRAARTASCSRTPGPQTRTTSRPLRC